MSVLSTLKNWSIIVMIDLVMGYTAIQSMAIVGS